MKILITGGAGFIGSALTRLIINETDFEVMVLDNLTYAGNLNSISSIKDSKRFSFMQADICDPSLLNQIFKDYKPNLVMHLAAESHVDKSISSPNQFIQTNIFGTYNLLEVSRNYFDGMREQQKKYFRFHHISTDEVFGDLHSMNDFFNEETPYKPSSPYSASKASSDHLVRAWGRTYGLPVMVTNCSNNYGPYQFPEKLIPLTIINALQGNKIKIFGNGTQIRDWLYVDDHARALLEVIQKGEISETYNIGGKCEKRNIEVVHTICSILNEVHESKMPGITDYKELITHVKDRPGHDLRYAIDSKKIENKIGWKPHESFNTGIDKTVRWYLNNQNWWNAILDGSYRNQKL